MAQLERTGDVFVLDLGEGDHRFNLDAFDDIGALLDEVEGAAGPRALVVTNQGKIWHNGIDLEWLGAQDGDGLLAFMGGLHGLFARLLTMPVPTVAAISGHAFAGGAMFALAHDVRMMRDDRGYFCLPEIDLGMEFTEGMHVLICSKTPQPARHRLAVLGERIGGPVAVDWGIAETAVPESELRAAAVERAASLTSKAGDTIVRIRRNFYGPAIDALLGV